MTFPILYVPARNCSVSPLNVRTQSDPQADAELEAMIGEAGYVLQNLIGVAEKRKKDKYSIFGGARRLSRVLALIERGTLADDFQVPVMVMPSTRDAIEISLAENQKLPMSAADECLAYRHMVDKEGKSPLQIAARFGKTERFVLGRLRLANLAEPVFDALRAGDLSLEVASAYGSTSDTARQASVFAQLAGDYYANNVNEIRRRLASGSYRGFDPKVLFVGPEDYREAGGRIDSDLFSSAETEIWLDADIVDRLAEAKLLAAAQALRALFEAIGGIELKSRYASSRKFDLAASAEKLFAGDVIIEAEVKDRALAWLPVPMRFTPEEAVSEPNQSAATLSSQDVVVSSDQADLLDAA
ncbi:MAG: ParB/Srx family N-terminal domain-containing protein [Sphingobium sp.]